ncbi:MAG TPA: TIR domain-containing protein, partial [Steroidobacteraceae bacterium]|nr:TIR domain-containing protein [Steroidobacteraceae bacterium]
MRDDSSQPRGAVFLSYASQDSAAAQRISEALQAAGIDVWFDRGELRGGDAWDHMIRQRIRDCALFVPVISASTAARPEGYFRLEWSLAEQRSHMQARNRTFILPVSIDDTPPNTEDVPESFTRVQWTRLPGGQVPREFTSRIATLLGAGAPAAAPGAVPPAAAPVTQPPAQRRNAWLVALMVVVVALLALRPWHWGARPQAAAAAAAPAPAAAGTPSVAVLPFADLSEHHDQEYFSDGLTEELIDTLTRIPQLRVPARTSSFSFKGKSAPVGEIGQALKVTHVLEGSVRTSGMHMRITAQLVRADDGYHVWSQTFDRDMHDIFQVQDEIARAVAEQLKLSLLTNADAAGGKTQSVEAHNLFLQAQYLVQRDRAEDLEGAVQLYLRALQLDPRYAAAYAALAYCHIRRVANGVDADGGGTAKAVAAAERAIELDPNLPEGYLSLAVARLQQLDFTETRRLLDKVAALDPNHALLWQLRGHLGMAVGTAS